MREIQKKPNAPIELAPHEWRSERPRRREPIFGDGALPFAGEIVATVAVVGLLILACWLGIYLKGEVHDLLYGSQVQEQRQSLPPGNYKWTPEKGVERID